MTFEKSSLWIGSNLDNTKQNPASYSEQERLEYRTYRHYLKSLERMHQKSLIEQLEKDKTLDKSLGEHGVQPCSDIKHTAETSSKYRCTSL